jgi:alpha-tubulin suppressor-like RCC1 family protein
MNAQGDYTNYFDKPIQIGTETNWIQICAGDGHNLVLKNDGSLWTCGLNGYGQLGINHSKSILRIIGTDRDWRAIAANDLNTFALKKNGTIWGWGDDGSKIDMLPQQIAPGTNWLAISACGRTMMVVKTDGTLWLKDSILPELATLLSVSGHVENLIQLGRDDNWSKICAGDDSFFGRKTDGSWWVCGHNIEKQLDLGTNVTAEVIMHRLPFDFQPWAFAPGVQTTLMLGKDGKLWSFGWHLSTDERSMTRRKFEVFRNLVVKRFPALGKLIKPKSDIDLTPHLLWELPAEVRRSLGTGTKNATNNLAN